MASLIMNRLTSINLSSIDVYAATKWANHMKLRIIITTKKANTYSQYFIDVYMAMSRFKADPTEIFDVIWNPRIVGNSSVELTLL